MTTERDPQTRIVLSWLREDAHENAERVLLQTLDAVDTTPQRRSWWPARRTDRMQTFAKLIAATAAVLVVAVAGYSVLPGLTGPGTPTSLLARGSFTIRDWGQVEFEANRLGFVVGGHLTIGQGRGPGWPLIVDLRCARTTADGLLMIGGSTRAAAGAQSPLWPQGSLAAVVLKQGSPVKAAIWVGSVLNYPGTESTDCLAYLDAWLAWSRKSLPGDDWMRDDIVGTVEFGPSLR